MAARLSGTVSKALDLLECFTSERAQWSATGLASATGIHKSTVVRLCATLESRGLLSRTPHGYRVGPSCARLGALYAQAFDLESLIRPRLEALRDKTGESASFYVRDGDERICLYRENSRHAIRHQVDEGARLPVGKGVAGRVLVAFSGGGGRDARAIREQGFLDAEGREPLTASVAAPVLDGEARMHGALVISGPSERFTEPARARARKAIVAAAAQLSAHLPSSAKEAGAG